MKYDPEFEIETPVKHRLRADWVGIITGIFQRPGCYLYYVAWSDGVERSHYAMELKLTTLLPVKEISLLPAGHKS